MRSTVALVCLTAGPGGVEHHVLDLAQSLRASVDVVVVAARGGWLDGRAKSAGLEVLTVPEPSGNADLRTLVSTRAALKQSRARIVHSHLARSDWYAWLATRGLKDVVLMSTEHGISDDRPDMYGGPVKRFAHQIGHRLRLRDTAVTIAVSQATARALMGRYARLRKSPPVVIRPGIDTDRFRSIRGPGREAGQPLRVATIGRLAPEKGMSVLVGAVAICRDRGVLLDVTVAGSGPLRVSLEEQSRELALDRCIRFVGHVDDVTQILADCDVLAVPSLAENLPLVVLEALSAGVPVVASDVGGVSEVVSPGVNGLLVPPSSDTGLAEALVLLAQNDALVQSMSQAAFESADGFGLATAAQETLAVYESLQ